VRVLLEEATNQKWVITNPAGMRVRDAVTKKEIPLKATFFEFDLSVNKNNLFINKCPFKREQLWIEPLGNSVCAINGQQYDGRLLIARARNKWYLMSVLDLEDYVFSVLKTESWPGWPVEVQKVLAIASRTYVLYQLLQAREKKLTYHIRNTNHHQTYTGLHCCPVIRQAVQETKGICLGYKGKPILAMFDCCCGGIVPGKALGFADFSKAPYLKRDYACTYCKNSKLYSWTATYTLDKVQQLVQEHHNAIIHDVTDIAVHENDPAGLVQKVVLKTKKNKVLVTAQRMYKSFKDVKSHCYSIAKKGKTIVFNGRGYGHHLGLCQWGARTMVDEGWDHADILLYYYPGTAFMQVEDGLSYYTV
jgi:stage II sporulation protein D